MTYNDPQNFDQLQRLLTLKRYEQPPPGYFHRFSSQVIQRIKLGEKGEELSSWQRFFAQTLWIQRLWTTVQTKPVVASVVGVFACILFITGVLFTESSDRPPSPYASSITATVADQGNSLFVPSALAEFQRTNDFIPTAAQGSFFGAPVRQVSYTLGN